jgi:hypothetical protein
VPQGLQVENNNLQNQLVEKTKELNSTLSEVLQLLDKGACVVPLHYTCLAALSAVVVLGPCCLK